MKRLQIGIESTKLANGLPVVIAPDSTAPVVTVGIYYKIGFRLEPQGRSGFAQRPRQPRSKRLRKHRGWDAPVSKERVVMNDSERAIETLARQKLARRDLLKLGGGALVLAVGASAIAPWSGKVLGQGRSAGGDN